MSQERVYLKIVNLLLLLGLVSSLLLAGCQGQLGINVDIGGGEGSSQGASGLDSEMVLALLLVLFVAVVIIAVMRR